MDKPAAVSIQYQLEQWSQHRQSTYTISKLAINNSKLNGFHQWADGKPITAAFHVMDRNYESFFLLLIDWHQNENYYLVVYLQDKSSTAAEIHRTAEDHDGRLSIFWTYNPLKRDGLNAERKAYFKQVFGSTTMQIPLPQTAVETETFLDQIFNLGRNRLRVDRIAELFNL
jgi:hypothetical protein